MVDGDTAQGGTGNAGTPAPTGTPGPTGTVLTGQVAKDVSGQAVPASTGTVTGWRSDPRFPKEYHQEKMFDNIKAGSFDEALPTVFKNYVEGQKYIGGAVKIPKVTDPPEKWNEFYGKIGRPEKAEDYKINPSGDMQLDEARLGGALKTMHGLGLTNQQVQGIMDLYAQDTKASMESYHTTQKQALATLKEEWGPTADRKFIIAQRAAQEYGGKELMEVLDKTGLGNNPAFIRFFADVGELLVEEGFISGKIEGVPGPQEAEKQIDAILADKSHPYNSKDNTPAHKQAVEAMKQLHELAYGTKR